ncbi:MAG: hypothetical protein K6F64_04815 [Clostridia bacterium]|nr:hypothetical protein [Clostridia bacterium]
MKSFDKFYIYSGAPLSAFAAELICNELNSRLNQVAEITADNSQANIIFITNSNFGRDEFELALQDRKILFTASGMRGFIFSVGKFLRSIVKTGSTISVDCICSGHYIPSKRIRGHQLGYRTTPNSYDAWDYGQYRRYYLDLMYFGVNTVEHIPYQNGRSKRNRLMKYDEEEFLIKAVDMADGFDLDVSLWYPNYDGETPDEAVKTRGQLFSKLKRLDQCMIPGGDPGNLPADEFVRRCIAISREMKKYHPDALMFPSAQSPHVKGWGEVFAEEMNKEPTEIDGIVYGPNHAFPLEELCSRLPERYPVRFYPDITHNVRCEYPVHFDKDDWHFALATGLSRECTNPRPREYEKLYRLTKDFVIGSVSYSEGVTDDVNKAVWSSLDYDEKYSADAAVLDYSRLFFFGADVQRIKDLIFALESNWVGDPALNDGIDKTYNGFCELSENYPILNNNWRFLQLYFRSMCDKLVRERRIFELNLISSARISLESGDFRYAVEILKTDFTDEYKKLRQSINSIASKLFDLIGLQTDVDNYCADNWERGAVLETIDLPVTDRNYLLSKESSCENAAQFLSYFDRNKVSENEYHYSVAYDGIPPGQSGEVYLNFQGDRPDVNRGDLPTALFNVYDNYSFKKTIKDLSDTCDYLLRVIYFDKKDPEVTALTVKANGETVYVGGQFGQGNPGFDSRFCKKGFTCAEYRIKTGIIKNGELNLEICEDKNGVMLSEFFLLKI